MRNKLPLKQDPQKICILRLSALGDVTHVLPVINALKQKWPDVEITWVCGVVEKKLLSALQGVRFVVFDKKQGWKAYLKLKKDLRNERFNVLLHLQVAARANIASLFIKADIRLGWDKSRSRDGHQLFVNHCVPERKQQHQVEGFLSFASALGADVSEPKWRFPLSKEAIEFSESHIPVGRKTLLISACSSHRLRNWSAGSYAKVADYAIEQLDMQVVLSGSLSQIERTMADSIEHEMKSKPINLVGKDTLQQLMAVLKKVDVVISPDSGPVHMASAVGTPVIGLYACTWAKRSGPYNSIGLCVDKFEVAAKQFVGKSASALRWGSKIERVGVMDLIKEEDVIDKLKAIVNGG